MSSYSVEIPVLTNASFNCNVWTKFNSYNQTVWTEKYMSPNNKDLSFDSTLFPKLYKSVSLVFTGYINDRKYNGFDGIDFTPKLMYNNTVNSFPTGESSVQINNVSERISFFVVQGNNKDVTGKIQPNLHVQEFNASTSNARLVFTIEHLDPTITNLSAIGQFWERPITVNWRSEQQEGYEYECYYNNTKVLGGTGGLEQSFSIPAKTYTGLLNASVRVRTFNTRPDGVKIYSDWVEHQIALKDIEAVISNLLVNGEKWENEINLTWQSNDQEQFKIEVLKNNSVVKTYTGTTGKSYIIPSSQLTAGDHTFIVWVAYSGRFVNNNERTVTLKDIIPTVKNVSLSGSNVDLPISVNWESTDQQNYVLEVWNNDVKVKEYTGTIAKRHDIPNNTLTTGLTVFKVKVAYKDRWTGYEQMSTTLVETLPSVGVLEPDGVITERDSQTRIWWTSQNQSKWRLVIDGATTYTGTAEKEKLLQAGELTTGQHSMVLTVWYVTSLGVEKTPVTKKAEWIVQGKPPIPTITCNNTFSTNRPVVTWDTQDQQGYILEVLKDNDIVYSTDWQNGLIVEHKVMEYLPNGVYTVRVKTMNQYSLESECGAKQITINATEATNIALNSIAIENSVQLTWDNEGNNFVKFYIIRNGEVIATTTTTAYTDHTAHLDSIYTIRGVTALDVYKDSNSVYERIEINRSILATVDNLEAQLKCAFFTSTDKFNASLGLECTLLEVSGRKYPVAIFGEHSSKAISLKLLHCDDLNKLIEMYERRQVFCYRDATEKAFFVIQSLPYTRDSTLTDFEGSISAVIIDYREGVEYD